jgi:hypothetical protein
MFDSGFAPAGSGLVACTAREDEASAREPGPELAKCLDHQRNPLARVVNRSCADQGRLRGALPRLPKCLQINARVDDLLLPAEPGQRVPGRLAEYDDGIAVAQRTPQGATSPEEAFHYFLPRDSRDGQDSRCPFVPACRERSNGRLI